MGALDQGTFDALVSAGCPACRAPTLEIRSIIDRSVIVMVGDPNDTGRWVHDGEKFVDGTYRITCPSCSHVAFESDMCPRCNAPDKLGTAMNSETFLRVPKRCPKCNESSLAVALAPAVARYGGGVAPKPKLLVDYGEPGYHVVAFACPSCDNAVVAERCALCDSPGPLRPRP